MTIGALGGAPDGYIRLAPRRVDEDPPLAAVLFDAGHTLIHEATPAATIAAAVLETLVIDVTPPVIEQSMAAAMDAVRLRWHRGDWWLSEESVRQLFVDAYRDELTNLPEFHRRPDMVDSVAAGIYETYQDPRHWRAYPEVHDVLERMRKGGLRMGVISDWGHGLEAILLELELGRFLEFLVVSARVGVGKPDPRVFELALNRINIPPDCCVYVGDTYVKDIIGARLAGIPAVLLDRAGDLPPVDCPVVRDLDGLARLVGLDDERKPSTTRHQHIVATS